MALPTSIEARRFYRCAFQRFDDAQVLLSAGRTTGAIYLAGYSVECILKALMLANLSEAAQAEMLASFRGSKAHDYEWLRTRYVESGCGQLSREAVQAFTLVNDWSTDLRYSARAVRDREAERFLKAAEQIIHWADGRI